MASGPADHSRPIGDLADPDVTLDVPDAITSKPDRNGRPYEQGYASLSTWLNVGADPTLAAGWESKAVEVLMRVTPVHPRAGHDHRKRIEDAGHCDN